MVNIKISEMPNAAALDGTEEVPVVQTGSNFKVTTQAIANLAATPNIQLTGDVIANSPSPAATTIKNNVNLGGSPTTTTQAGNDNSTKIATTAQVQAAIALIPAAPVAANPTATAKDTAVNGIAATFMRSDAAPAIQKASNAQFGLVEGDGSTISIVAGVASVVNPAPAAANPTGTAGPTAVNGVATTFMRSDGAPAVQKCSNSQFGLAEPDNDTIQSTVAGVIRSKRNDISFNFSGVPANSQKFTYIANRAFTLPASLTGSQACIGTNPTGTLTVTLNKNGSSIGSIAFSTGGVPTFTFASQVAFAIGDILTTVCPGSADATGADIAASLQGFLS